MKLDENFNSQEFTNWLEEFLPDFSINVRKVDIPKSFKGVKSIQTIGESAIGVRVYIIETDADPSTRKVGLATDSFNLLKSYASPNAIIAYFSKDAPLWRISLLTSTPIWSEGKIITKLSNPKRQSYVLGSKAKIKTPYQFLLNKGQVIDFTDLKSRFSLEVVNKEFYKEISQAFTKLVGGTVANGKSKKTFEPLLKLPSLQDRSQINLEFAVRLIGRIIFCWFLREKRSEIGHSLIPKELVSFDAVNTTQDYYHKILEPIFFEILNKPIRSRKENFINDLFSAIPYLNGGLFSPHEDDFFNYNEEKQTINHNMVVVPDEWLKSFFEVLETYNFTIDENTSFDEELSIDPEMLGRIFENLLAEINPETGESARKSTGSYYTPRIIVDYMIDESLLLYLKEKTGIAENRLRSLISYDLEDDQSDPLNEDEKDKITQLLGTIKILDPACGSGAFPIGALQKIVFILQQIDQNGQLWFKKQILNTPIELRKVIEREFQEKNFDYIRKLGIIRENIYGIDIQPIATEISRLRCFLTLVVDERIDDSLENRGIEPLPNLDFKFVTANSLIGLPKIKLDQQELFDDNAKIDQLKSLRDQYFTARNEERKDIMIAFSELQSEMINELIDVHSFIGVTKAELTRKLTDWKPFKHKSTDWFDPEWMFGIKEGFDIVIANPPYVFARNSAQKGLTDEDKKYFYKNYVLAKYQVNLYALFIELSTKMLKNGGCLSFITPNNWLTINTNKALRQFILDKSNIIIINYYARVFESASVDSAVVIFVNDRSSPFINLFEYTESLQFIKRESCKYFLDQKEMIINIESHKNPNITKLIEKIEHSSDELKNRANVKAGLKAYEVGKGEPKQTKLMKDKRVYHSKEIPSDDYYRYLEGRDVSRYKLTWSGEYLKYGKNLAAPRGNFSLFSTNRILVRQIPGKQPYCIHACSTNEVYLNDLNSMNIVNLKDNPEYILGLLNSRLLSFWFVHKFGKLQRGTFPQFKINELEIFPIVKAPDKLEQEIVNLVINIKNIKLNHNDTDTSGIDMKIDQLVYKLYELTPEEIRIVEGSGANNE